MFDQLHQLQDLIFFKRVFAIFEKLSGLPLNPRKCILILTVFECTDQNVKVLRRWLDLYCSEWNTMIISDGAKYLGIYIGPKVRKLLWKKPLSKFQDRVNNIHSLKLPPQLARQQFITKAIPVLAYVAQVAPLPPT